VFYDSADIVISTSGNIAQQHIGGKPPFFDRRDTTHIIPGCDDTVAKQGQISALLSTNNVIS